ncbi:MAG: hypothetical protein K2P50_14675 [Lachnospiraceae bacterium]|nr:hypothetical protein [Lachnospiraceae bacterium]
MRKSYGERLTGLMAFAVLIGIYFFYNTYADLGGFGVGYQYIGCIVIVIIGCAFFLAEAGLFRLYASAKAAGILALPYFAAMVCSAGIWIFSFTPVRQMISGFFEPAYMILCILCAALLTYIFRENAALYSFWALSAALLLMTSQKIAEFGPSEFFGNLFEYVKSAGKTGGGVSLEDTSFSYAYVFFCIYFIFGKDARGKKEKWWKLPLRLLMILAGMLEVFKRSSFLALAAGIGAAFLYALCKGRYRKWLVNLMAAGFIFFAFFYIPFIRYGLFNRIVEALNIDTSARTRIYNYYAQYYEFSPNYTGRGLGFIWQLMERAERFNVGLVSVNVHCDYVRAYIELGFWGYLCWIITVFPLPVKRLIKGISAGDDAVILGVAVAMAVLRLTENVSQLYSAVLTMGIIIIRSVLKGQGVFDAENSSNGQT